MRHVCYFCSQQILELRFFFTYWNPKFQCPEQTADSQGVCQLINMYILLANWVNPGLLITYSCCLVFFCLVALTIPSIDHDQSRFRRRRSFDCDSTPIHAPGARATKAIDSYTHNPNNSWYRTTHNSLTPVVQLGARYLRRSWRPQGIFRRRECDQSPIRGCSTVETTLAAHDTLLDVSLT